MTVLCCASTRLRGASPTLASDLSDPSFAGLDVTADGSRLVVTDGGTIFVLQQVPDIETTVTGVVVDSSGNPVDGAAVSCFGQAGVSAVDGTFSIPGVTSLRGLIRCNASHTPGDGVPRSGIAGGVVPVPLGTTDLGRLVADIVYTEDFQASIGPEWSSTVVSYTPTGRRRFLGELGSGSVTLNLIDLPAHDRLTVRFDLFAIRSWNGNATTSGPDVWSLGGDGVELLRTTFLDPAVAGGQAYPGSYPGQSNPATTGATAVDVLGYVQSGDPAIPSTGFR